MTGYIVSKKNGEKLKLQGSYKWAFANALNAYEELGKISGWEYRPKTFHLWHMGNNIKYSPTFVVTTLNNKTVYIDVMRDITPCEYDIVDIFKEHFPEKSHLFIDKAFFSYTSKHRKVNDLMYTLECIEDV